MSTLVNRIVTITGLIPRSNYTIDVRAIYSSSVSPVVTLSGPPAAITAETGVPPGNPFLSLSFPPAINV